MDRTEPDAGKAGGVCSGQGQLPRPAADGAPSSDESPAPPTIVLDEDDEDDMAVTIPAPPRVPAVPVIDEPVAGTDDFDRKFRDSDPAKKLRSAQSQTMARISHFAQLIRDRLGVTKIPPIGKLPKP